MLDYYTGIKMVETSDGKKRKFWFLLSIFINLGFLGIFKYFNFFSESFAQAVAALGLKVNPWTLQVILPVGISFYTFHGLSYVIDIYKDRIKPEYDFVNYSVFVSFFPLLVAGPIERATHLLPQIKKKRLFNYSLATQGIRQIIWGFFKKVVVADNCAFFVNSIFENPQGYSSLELWIGMFLFGFQIYCDFSGYSDIALGTAKLFGIELLRNFNFPYFSKDIAEFWRRWHISLSTWFRDYLYIPLGGNKGSKSTRIRNTFIIFLVSGFWHGANWTFIVWGAIHAFLFLPLLMLDRNRINLGDSKYGINDIFKILSTFLLVSFAWIFFRSENLAEAFAYLHGMFNPEWVSLQFFHKTSRHLLLSGITFIAILFLLLIEWKNVKHNNSEIELSKMILFIVILMIFFMGSFKDQANFIYFQF
ncbi:MAG: MBOAT family O-acyltransferase [Daejeonella sp.]